MPMLTGNWENPQFYGQWKVEDSQNWLFAKKFKEAKKSISLEFRFVNLEIQGSMPNLNIEYQASNHSKYGVVWWLACNFFIADFIGASLSKPHTRGTPLHMVWVYMFSCLLVATYFSQRLNVHVPVKSDSEGLVLAESRRE